MTQKELFSYSQVNEVGAHVHWLWHFHASLYDAASYICMEEYHLCEDRIKTVQQRSWHWNRSVTLCCWLTFSHQANKGQESNNEYVSVYLHAAVGQWQCVGITWHALLLTVIRTGCWSSSVAHVSVVWVYRLPPRPVREERLLCGL